ncbi:MAG: hypothetical protein AB1716_06905 [Planctomycetota bacterium]
MVDEQTGRGVPLVELSTTNNIRYWTDSRGVVAFYEPGLTNTRVFFHVKSHGYEFPKDGFGFAGQALETAEGGSATLKIRRINIAERLYRVTGQGIYRDTLLLGEQAPTAAPAINGLVLGSDSVSTAQYRGRIFWLWGDTNWPAYPLGNFQTTGATSRLPTIGGPETADSGLYSADRGLDPDAGVELEYFVDPATGFAKKLSPHPASNPVWLDALVALPEEDAAERAAGQGSAVRERLFAAYARVTTSMEAIERGVMRFDDERQEFEKVREFDLKAPLLPTGHPFRHTEGGVEYLYFPAPFPWVRTRASVAGLLDLAQYEGYTCLKPGARLGALIEAQIDRAEDGTIRYAWRTDAPALGPKEQAELVKSGRLAPHEGLIQLCDVETGKPVTPHSGSVYWNAYRRRWITIRCEVLGSSVLGETWFAEADTPVGPWVYARKIVTHDKYSFYNPKQQPLLDRDGGRVIYFEGTYSATFSGNTDPTPRYDYNQIMYRLDLADPRLRLPVAVYSVTGGPAGVRFSTGAAAASDLQSIAFFALERAGAGTVAVCEDSGESRLVVAAGGQDRKPLFHGLPADRPNPLPNTVLLHEFAHAESGRRVYRTGETSPGAGWTRTERPLCRVWASPFQRRD